MNVEKLAEKIHEQCQYGASISDIMSIIDNENVLNIDYDAISWAYYKLLAFGLGNGDNMDTSLMMDRLNLMLLMQDE